MWQGREFCASEPPLRTDSGCRIRPARSGFRQAPAPLLRTEYWPLFAEGYSGDDVYELDADDTHLILGSRGHGLWRRPLTDLPLATSAPDLGNATGSLVLGVGPNPFPTQSWIELGLESAAAATLRVYDIRGRLALAPIERSLSSGRHRLDLDAAQLPSGVYFYRVEAAGQSESGRLLVLR
jgi:hypothetical protein